MSVLAEPLTKQEKTVRQKFVDQYMVDLEPVSAAIRLGYQEAFAQQYAKQFMGEPYTLELIAKKQQELGCSTEEEQHRRRVVAGLYRITGSRFASASAQVAAYAQIAKIVGLEAPIKTEVSVTPKSSINLSSLTDEEADALQELMDKMDAASKG